MVTGAHITKGQPTLNTFSRKYGITAGGEMDLCNKGSNKKEGKNCKSRDPELKLEPKHYSQCEIKIVSHDKND